MKNFLVYIFILIMGVSLSGCDNNEGEGQLFLIAFDANEGSAVDSINVTNSESIQLPESTRTGFHFIGWTLSNTGNSEILDEDFYPTKDVTLFARWEAYDYSEIESYLLDILPISASENVVLPSSHDENSISWESSHPEIIDTDGAYNRPYQTTLVQLDATIQYNDHSIVREYEIEVEGYKSLEAPFASSYIYRDYYKVDELFFSTLDVINCAFIHADETGNLTGTSVLDNINTYIMPKAKENGNWVLFSISPSSEWSELSSSTGRINNFADSIVEMINEYGFDGVDIDWETPTTHETSQFVEMIEVVYSKVKENNPNHLVTAAIAGGMWQPQNYDLSNSHQYLDYINMMTYGMVSNNGYYQNALFSSRTFNDIVNNAGKTLTSCSIEESVAIYNSYGIPNSKIVAGVAFYGIKQTRTYNSSTQTWSSWSKDVAVSYTYISNTYLNNDDYKYSYDHNASVPYIMKKDGSVFISYDNPRSIADKSEYIIDNGLAGMMYWENGHDSTGALLIAMTSGLND